MTPYQRVVNSEHIPVERKEIIKQLHQALNPITLSKEEKKIRMQIDSALKALKKGQTTTGLLKVPPLPAFFLDYEKNNVSQIGISKAVAFRIVVPQ